MNKSEIINKMTRSFHRINFKVKKHSPEILVVAGVVGTVASTVMACKATTKLGTILDESKKTIDTIHYAAEHPEELPEEYTIEDSKKDLAIVYAQTGIKVAKLYAPAVILGAVSITGIIASNHILRKRNIASAAAYAAVSKSFKEYRSRVVERFGKDLDKELKYNVKAITTKETVVDEETGKKKTVKNTVEVINPALTSEFSKFYDDGCLGWDKDPEYNLMFLRRQQDHANDLLRTRGHLFLNEVYDLLGIQRTKAGQVVGWLYDEVHPTGDNYVDFGIYNCDIEANRDFVNGYERAILLDFNVDGNILEMM